MFGEKFKRDNSTERNNESDQEDEEEAPLLFVDVNLGPND
jgi:hypothetical protein